MLSRNVLTTNRTFFKDISIIFLLLGALKFSLGFCNMLSLGNKSLLISFYIPQNGAHFLLSTDNDLDNSSSFLADRNPFKSSHFVERKKTSYSFKLSCLDCYIYFKDLLAKSKLAIITQSKLFFLGFKIAFDSEASYNFESKNWMTCFYGLACNSSNLLINLRVSLLWLNNYNLI